MINIINPGEFRKKKRSAIPKAVFENTESIINNISENGFQGVIEYTKKFDGFELNAQNLRVKEIGKTKLTDLEKKAINEAFERVNLVQRQIASNALRESKIPIDDGFVLFKPKPIERVGIYVPGGLAPLPSSLLMAGITAKAAGVKDIVVCTPPQKDCISPAIFYLAQRLGITEIYQIGGAQAIAAMAYGLPNLKKVDMVCGPGNVYVTAAKQIVSSRGLVKVDLVAGPSEVLIIADETARADYVAADMLAQAEHGTNSPAILLTTSENLAKDVQVELNKQLVKTAEKSLVDCGAIILVINLQQAIDIANDYAPEHLEILTKDSDQVASKITNAGAIFINTCESFADYGMSGGNHILPTGGTAKFLSGLSVYDFLVRTYVEFMSNEEQEKLAELAGTFADIEGLKAHANAARFRGRFK
ncbi:histidinol dehydrogenase [Candidatus Micrarchaeota archaeon]|nr:histidinol dehydrogenase [Candidatus Micrarchaeota archaeon]